MTHTPPVPEGNQSPYPLHEAPHAQPVDGPPPGAEVARTPEPRGGGGALLAIVGAAGAIALAAGAAWAYERKPAKKPARRKAKRAPRKRAAKKG